MNKKLLWIIAFTFSLCCGQSVFADKDKCGEKLSKMVNELNLDKDQKEKVKPVIDNLKTTLKDNAEQMKDIRTQMSQQILSDKMDKANVDSLIDKKMTLVGNMMKAKAAAMNEIYGILNDKQKAKVQDKMKKIESKMAEKYKSCKEED